MPYMDEQLFPSHSPWVRISRKVVAARGGEPQRWVYYTSGRNGREHATAPVDKMAWPQGCDQCARLIGLGEQRGARSVRVNRGTSPTTLFLCAGCVTELCRVCGVPEPASGA